MEIVKKYIQNEPDKKTRSNWLELAKKDSRGIPMPYPPDNPVHRVKLLRGEEGTKTNYRGIEEKGVFLTFLEDGIEKKYFVPIYVTDKNSENYGKFNYLFQAFENINEGDELEMEYVRKGKTGFVDVRRAGEKRNEDDIPVIEDAPIDEIPPEYQ